MHNTEREISFNWCLDAQQLFGAVSTSVSGKRCERTESVDATHFHSDFLHARRSCLSSSRDMARGWLGCCSTLSVSPVLYYPFLSRPLLYYSPPSKHKSSSATLGTVSSASLRSLSYGMRYSLLLTVLSKRPTEATICRKSNSVWKSWPGKASKYNRLRSRSEYPNFH